MPDTNWNDLRYVLAIARAGTLAGAARKLSVDETTVGRRLAAMEAALGARLFRRAGKGRLQPSQAGESAIARAERVELEVDRLRDAIAHVDARAAGTVRLTSVPILINRVLIPLVPALIAQHPALRLELIAEPRDLSLTKREADIALRLARPRADAGQVLLARRIGHLPYAVYASATRPRNRKAPLPWIIYEDAMADLPQARWMAAAMARDGTPNAPIAVNDAEAILQAVRAGLGRSLLPRALGDRTLGLRRLDMPPGSTAFSRELWLLVHPDLRPLARIAAVIDWLESVVQKLDVAK